MKLCLYSHYSEKHKIPNYVLYWVEQLKKHVDRVIILTNDRPINNLSILNVIGCEIVKYQNKGYDFGMYYKWLMSHKLGEIDELYLINDSTILFNNLNSMFDWIQNREEDLIGLTDTTEVKYHIQSYFWRLNKSIIPIFQQYLSDNGLIEDFNEVIRKYEIGFCDYLINSDFKLKAKYNHHNFTSEGKLNSTIHNVKKLIDSGLPIIKKKVLFNTFNNDEIQYLKSINYNFKFNYTKEIINNKDETLNVNYLKEI